MDYRVLNIIDTGGSGGAETVFCRIAAGLHGNGFEVYSLIGRTGWLSSALTELQLPHGVAPTAGSFDLRYLSKLYAEARDFKADIICTHLLGPAVYGSIAGRLASIPVVSIFHGDADFSASEKFVWLKRLAIRHGTTKLVYVSASLHDQLQPIVGFPEKDTLVQWNGSAMTGSYTGTRSEAKAYFGLQAGSVLVAAIGNVRPSKNYSNLLSAIASLRRISPQLFENLSVIIAGDTNHPEFESVLELRTSLGLVTKVEFLGFRHDTDQLLRAADLFVISSNREGFSLACVEAMLSSVPVVSTRCGGPEEILGTGDLRAWANPHDPEGLAEAIAHTLSNPSTTRALVEGAFDRANRLFTSDAMIARYRRLFESLLNHR